VRSLLIPCVLALAVLLGEGPARADARTEKAREHYLQGDAYYKLDKYADALHEYEQAYIAKPDPSFLYNIAQCHRLMGNKPEAIKFYRRYLNDAPGVPNRAIAEKHIKELEAAMLRGPEAADAEHAPAGSAPALPPRPMPAPVSASTPTPAPNPGPRSTPEKLALEAPPPASPPPASPPTLSSAESAAGVPEPAHPFYTKWWFWTGVGAVVLGALIVGAAASRDPSCPAGSTCK
jgi:tetratricopeptide (TPR) repeat protein